MDFISAGFESQAGLTPEQEPDFKIYLERSGILDLLTNALSCVFKEHDKWLNLMECIKSKIVAASYNPGAQKFDQLSKKVLSLNQTVEKLQEENRKLRISLGLAESPLHRTAGGVVPEVVTPVSPSAERGPSRAKVVTASDHGTASNRSISKGPGTKRKK